MHKRTGIGSTNETTSKFCFSCAVFIAAGFDVLGRDVENHHRCGSGGFVTASALVCRHGCRRVQKARHGGALRRPGARTIQALVGGSVQFAQGVSSRTVPAAGLAGADAVLIANFSDKLLFTMHSAPEIHTLQDLKGKIVGVSGIGGSTDFATRLALR